MRDLKKEVITTEEYDEHGKLIKKVVKTTERVYLPSEETNRYNYQSTIWYNEDDSFDPDVSKIRSHPLHPRTSEG